MKKYIVSILSFILITLMITGCGGSDGTIIDSGSFCAYIKEVKGNTIVLDVAEYITREDTERIAELKLTEHDMPSGYHIYNEKEKLETYVVTEETVYNFIDWGNDFVSFGSDRNVSTTDIEVFVQYLNTYTNATPGMPFFFEISEGKIVSITEKPMA